MGVVDGVEAEGLFAVEGLLGMERVQDEPGWVVIGDAPDRPGLAFARVPGYRPPTWPEGERPQYRHFDVRVDNLDEAEAEFRLATEQLRAARESRQLAELEVKRAEELLAQRSIYSPVTGVVVAVLLRPGELTSSNQKDPIVKVMEVDPLNVELVLPLSQFGKIKVGQRARVMPEQPVGGVYSAAVEVVDSTLDAASGTFGVRLKLPNPGGRIPAGVKCRARF